MDMSDADDTLAPETKDENDVRHELPPATFTFPDYSLRLQAELNIGLLAVVRKQTRGNLSVDEQRTPGSSATELRFRRVQQKVQAADQPANESRQTA